MNKLTLMVMVGVGSIVVGLPYMVGLFGPTEAEVGLWGLVACGLGLLLLLLAIFLGERPAVWAKIILAFGYFGLALLQLLPIILWFEFHGRGISDGTPSSWFTAHWLFALPHLLLLGGSLGLIFLLFSRRKGVLTGFSV